MLLLPITLLGFWLRVYRLGDKAVWWDEGLAAWAARQSLPAMSAWTANDVHPPLYFWLLHGWRQLSGDSEFGLRLLSVFIGVWTIPAAYLLGRVIGGRRVGLLAALFVAVSRFGIAWAQEMRMYALVALLAALAMWAAVRVWRNGPAGRLSAAGLRDWALYVGFMTAGLYALYLFVLVLVVINLAWLGLIFPRARGRAWRELWTWSLGQAAVLLLFAPWLAYALGRIPTWTSASPVAFWDFLTIYWTVLVTGVPLNVADYAAVTLPVLAIFLAGVAALLARARRRLEIRPPLAMLLLGLLLPALIVYLVSLPKTSFFYAPQIAPRYLITFLAGYAVLLAWGIVQLADGLAPDGSFGRLRAARWQPLLAALLTVIVLIGAGAGLRGYHRGRVLVDDYKSLARTLAVYEQPGDAVILYTDTDWPIWAYHHPGDWRGVPHAWQITPEQAADFLTPIWEAHDGAWLVVTPYAGVSDPQGHMVSWLTERATAVSTWAYGDKTMTFFARTPARASAARQLAAGAAPQHALSLAVGPGARLVGFDQAARDARSGDAVHLALYWQTDGASAEAEVGLMDSSGQARVWALTAVPARADDLVRQELTLTLPPDAPGDAYTFYAFNRQGETRRFGSLTVRQSFGAVLQAGDVRIANRLDADFGDNIRLLGYDVETADPRPGGIVYLTLYWQARAPVAQRYKVFTHLLGDVFNAETDNFLWGQQDNEPVNLTRPTTSWRVGEVIVDSYAIPIAGHAPAGDYRIEIGLYEPAGGARLPLLEEDGETAVGDHLVLTAVRIAPAP